MDDAKITRVRYGQAEANELLRNYVFEGRFGGPRAPRGIAPTHVSAFVKASILPTTGPTAIGRVLEVLRFYERQDVVDHLMVQFLKSRPADQSELRRSLLVVQIAGDLGTDAQIKQAADFIDDQVVNHPSLNDEFPLLFQTFVVLAPLGNMNKSVQRLTAEIIRAEPQRDASDEGLRTYTVLKSADDNERKRATRFRDAKTRILAMSPNQRRTELTSIYLDESSLSTSYMELWAARLLRREAFDADPAPVLQEFTAYLDKALPAGAKAPAEEFHYVRAVQALVYLGGKPAARHQATYDALKERTLNFLWDDPPEAVPANRRSEANEED